ncbi:hypothetical protein R1flu_007656 [Riccia fluitans]|uniref:Homeobox domain-containing protein n=1 Tax=Riccia fluitans TaxID=41844 RepID=A0ABD1Z2J8_9MARC
MMATSARAYNAANVMLMRSESTSADTLVAMLASCGAAPGMQAPRNVGVGGLEEAVMGGRVGQKRPFYPIFDTSEENGGDDDGGEDCSHHVEKKRRLTVDQVRSLEKNFELENKLEPERKMQLARELGLQPRQVAVWFQNRRARWKTKQLERDYDVLKSDYDNLKLNFDAIVAEKEKLHAEILQLTKRLQANETQRVGDLGQVLEAGELDVIGLGGSLSTAHLGHASQSTELLTSVAAQQQGDDEYQQKKHIPAMGSLSPGKENSPIIMIKCSTKDKEGSTSSESNSSEIMNADSPHPIDSGLSPGVDQKVPNGFGTNRSSSNSDEGVAAAGVVDPILTAAVDASLVQFAEELCPNHRLVPPQGTGGGGGGFHRISVKVEDEGVVGGGVGSSSVLQEECTNYFYTIDDHGSLPWWEWP